MAAEPTLRASVHVQFSSHYTKWLPWRSSKNDFVLQALPLSLAAMFRYIRFLQIVQGKQLSIENKRFEKTRYTPGTLSDTNY